MASCSAGVSFKKGEKTQYKVRREARIPIQSVIIASYIHTLGGIGSAQKSFFSERKRGGNNRAGVRGDFFGRWRRYRK